MLDWKKYCAIQYVRYNVKFTFVHTRDASLIHPAQSNRKNPHSSHKKLWCSRTGLSNKRHTSNWERFHFEPTQRSAVSDGAKFPHFFSTFELFYISALAKSSPLWCFQLKSSDRFKFISALCEVWQLAQCLADWRGHLCQPAPLYNPLISYVGWCNSTWRLGKREREGERGREKGVVIILRE